jgi:hypothetical protein
MWCCLPTSKAMHMGIRAQTGIGYRGICKNVYVHMSAVPTQIAGVPQLGNIMLERTQGPRVMNIPSQAKVITLPVFPWVRNQPGPYTPYALDPFTESKSAGITPRSERSWIGTAFGSRRKYKTRAGLARCRAHIAPRFYLLPTNHLQTARVEFEGGKQLKPSAWPAVCQKQAGRQTVVRSLHLHSTREKRESNRRVVAWACTFNHCDPSHRPLRTGKHRTQDCSL